MTKGVKKVLLRAPNWIGDAVMALPALDALKGLYPEAAITVLAKPRVAPVFENSPAIAGIKCYEEKRHGGLLGRLALSRELKAMGFELAVLFQNAFDAAFISFLSRIPERVGYARDLRSGLLTRPMPVTDDIRKRHQAFYYLNIVEALGARPVERPVPRIHMTEGERAWARGFLSDQGLSGKRIFGAAPGASYGPAKRWGPDRFAGVLSGLAGLYGGAALVFGAPEDREAAASVVNAMPKALDLTGRLTLRQAMALVATLDCFVCNDSGPMHISAALGTPTVAVFGSTEDSLTGPLGERTAVARKKPECSPCFKRECRYGHYDCLARVTVGDALAAARSLIDG